ncbi:MAG: histidine kinase N-terminal 7TM domain-containing protein [Anaerolineales bacterium]
MHFHYLLLIPAFATIINILLAWFSWRKRHAEGALAFALVMLAAAIWSAGNAFELSATDLSLKIFWMKFEYLGILLLPAAWLIFALQYTGKKIKRRLLLLLAVEPVIMYLLLLTNDSHGWFTRQFGLKQTGALVIWDNIAGPTYWVNIAYSYCLILAGSFLLLNHLSHLPTPYSKRELVVVIGVILPWFINILYALYDFPIPGLDPTPFTLTLTGLAFGWGLFSLHILDHRPSPTSPPDDLPTWRVNILTGILRGIFILWFFGLASGINNAIKNYHLETSLGRDALALVILAIGVYIGVTIFLAVITFWTNLSYKLRAGLLLFIFYILGALGMGLSSFSGDGRLFLFAFIILSAIFFDLHAGLRAFAISLITLLVIAWLQLTGVIVISVERQANATDPDAWTSGTIIFLILSIATLISVTYLLRTLQTSLEETRNSLTREQHLGRLLRTVSNINQLIVRERNPQHLFQQACEALVKERGYSTAWIGLLEQDGVTLTQIASAGSDATPSHIKLQKGNSASGATCAAQAITTGNLATIENCACTTCQFMTKYHACTSVALPLRREGHPIGVLVITQHPVTNPFGTQELSLLNELADNLSYALENIRTGEQQHTLSEVSTALLFAPNEDILWEEVISAAQRLLRADRVAIYLYDRESDRLSCPRHHGLSAEYIAELNRQFHNAPGSAMITDPRPTIVQDVEHDPRTLPLREWMRREGFRSYAAFPFYVTKIASGAFTAYRNTPGPFTAADRAAGETLVRIVGLALENIKLNMETRQKAAELGALYAAAQDMTSSFLDGHALLHTLAHHMVETLQSTSAYISTVNLADRTLCITAEYWSERASAAERKSDLGRIYPLDDYPAFCEALMSGKAVTLHHDTTSCSEAEKSQFADYTIYTILFIPVLARGKILGGIEIWESHSKREFTQAEVFLAQSMAAHAGSILENTALYEQTRRHADELARPTTALSPDGPAPWNCAMN